MSIGKIPQSKKVKGMDMTEETVLDASVLKKYQESGDGTAREALLEEAAAYPGKIIVLDDDPTGTQTVHHIPVYTEWTLETFEQIFDNHSKLNYVLTNSRAFSAAATERVHREIAANISRAAKEKGSGYLLVSRGDSTLRGHFPLETQVLKEVLEEQENIHFDGEILCPFFREGGRFTINNIHYVKEGNRLIPAGQTEFARDKTFGYLHSDLCRYIEEKTGGQYRKQDVITITLEELEEGKLSQIEGKLMGAEHFQKIVVNAVTDANLDLFCTALYRVMKRGKHFLHRTAAAFVRSLAGISQQPLLSGLPQAEQAGMILVGSHTGKTTRQLEALRKIRGLKFLEMDVTQVQREGFLEQESRKLSERCSALISQGLVPVVYTSRRLITAQDGTGEGALDCSVKISRAVQEVVANLTVRPAYVLAKGGITSSDVATKALGIKQAWVEGQIAPGVPVWRTGAESLFPGMHYIIFPGNVGNDDTLYQVVEILQKKGQ